MYQYVYIIMVVILLLQSELRNVMWGDVLVRLKEAQREHKMNIRIQELTKLGVPL